MALTSSKGRTWLTGCPTIDHEQMPVKASAVIYAGAALMWSAGALTPLSGAGVFAGFALEDATGGGSDGAVTMRIRSSGGIRMNVAGGDTPSLGIVGVAATVPEMTDDDTLRIETGSAITGTSIGKFLKAVTLVANGLVDVHFKAAQVA